MGLLTSAPRDESLRDAANDHTSGWKVGISNLLYLSFVLLATTAMLIINAVVCMSMFSVFVDLGPETVMKNQSLAPHLRQLFYFVVPVVLTILEWNLFDRLNRLFRRV